MCGIAGYTQYRSATDPAVIRKAVAAIVHRGPDQFGVFESRQIALGAVRLRIIDLSGGRQPMQAGDAVIVFNGEIYNHVALREELEGLGERFDSHCDTEVVLRGFLRWGAGCFERLRGMFAFAIWLQGERRLILARDRLGIKPLYYRQLGDELIFGSEMKCLFTHPRVERHIDLEGLNRYLSLNYIPGPHTMIEGIRKLPPGHWMEWHAGQIQLQPYWRPPRDQRELSLNEAKEELDSLLRQSVREHLISDVPLGVWLSGGLDSSTILHYAASEVSVPLRTFSVSFSGRSFDESPYFRQVAARYGTEHHEFDLCPEPNAIVDTVTRMPYYSDEPSADAGALPVWYLSQMCRRHVTVALSGEGADELFGGYYTYLADRYAGALRLAPAAFRRLALWGMSAWPASDEKISFEYKVRRMLAGSLLDPSEAHFFWNGTFSSHERRRLLEEHAYLRMPKLSSRGEHGTSIDQRTYLPDDILYKCDRMSMAHSLEVRPPFLDHRIVEFAARLPVHMKIRGSKLKFILRELMRDKLPEPVLRRKKEGFDIPSHDWFRTILRPLLLDTVTEEAVRQSGFLCWPEVERVLADHQSRRANYGYHLWGLLTLFLWIKQWEVQPPRCNQEQREAHGAAYILN